MGETILQARIRMRLRKFKDVYKKKRLELQKMERNESSKGPDLGLLFFSFQNFLFLITCSKVLIIIY